MNTFDTIVRLMFFPTSLTAGFLLALIYTTLALPLLWRIYAKSYPFEKKEKAMMFTLSFLFMLAGTVFSGTFFPIITWGFLAFHFMVDRKYMELPDGINLVVALFSLLTIIPRWHDLGFIESGVLTGLALFIIFLLFAFAGPMGGGDIKMMGAIGLYFSMWVIPSLLLYGFLIGSIQGVGLMIAKRQKKGMLFAFGPALILGVLTTLCLKGGMLGV